MFITFQRHARSELRTWTINQISVATISMQFQLLVFFKVKHDDYFWNNGNSIIIIIILQYKILKILFFEITEVYWHFTMDEKAVMNSVRRPFFIYLTNCLGGQIWAWMVPEQEPKTCSCRSLEVARSLQIGSWNWEWSRLQSRNFLSLQFVALNEILISG